MARASNPANTRLRPQFRNDTDMASTATKLTAPRAFCGTIARRSIMRATGGLVATTYPVNTTIAICSVKVARSQNPSPNAVTTVCGEEPLASAATATTTTPASANTYASGNHFSVHPASDWATRASPFSEGAPSVAGPALMTRTRPAHRAGDQGTVGAVVHRAGDDADSGVRQRPLQRRQ